MHSSDKHAHVQLIICKACRCVYTFENRFSIKLRPPDSDYPKNPKICQYICTNPKAQPNRGSFAKCPEASVMPGSATLR